ncbi:hypothetical protein [Jannaschia sp. R86511]|uniref:hypothetical protein n=1 Tax=Jannaschia sp. R86511 TaxID=3093853 RepID=UPI0036D3DA48
MPGDVGGRGRRARRRAAAPRPPLGPWVAWVVFTLLMSAGVLLLVGVPGSTVAWLLLGGVVVGAVLLVAVTLSPPAP